MADNVHTLFNDRIRQILMVGLLVTLLVLTINQLYFLAPGFLGAITLYILSRDGYMKLIVEKKWKRGLAASFFLGLFTIAIGLPVSLSVVLLIPRIKNFVGNSEMITKKAEGFAARVQSITGFDILTPERIKLLEQKMGNMIPELLSHSALVVGNFVLLLFLCYFMLTEKERMEKVMAAYIPLKGRNVDLLGTETRNMVRANAIGIPLISIIQGAFAGLGYWIFGVGDFVLWGFITGVFSFFPVIGTSLVWIPICISHFQTHPGWQAVGLVIYSIAVIGNIDYLARISILKRIGQVHPIITIIGVVLGLKLFGFWGFIFGPLLISYLILLVKIYSSEFGSTAPEDHPIKAIHKPKNLRGGKLK